MQAVAYLAKSRFLNKSVIFGIIQLVLLCHKIVRTDGYLQTYSIGIRLTFSAINASILETFTEF